MDLDRCKGMDHHDHEAKDIGEEDGEIDPQQPVDDQRQRNQHPGIEVQPLKNRQHREPPCFNHIYKQKNCLQKPNNSKQPEGRLISLLVRMEKIDKI